MAWWQKYLGIPFVHDASEFDGADCGGLVLLVLREEIGSTVLREATADRFTREKKHNALIHYAQYFERVDDPQEFDVFMLRRHGAWNHCGVVLPDGYIIHACEGDQSRREKRTHSPHELQGYYRLKNEYRTKAIR